MLKTIKGQTPRIALDTFIAPSADIIGDVVIGAGSSIWYNTVLRADYNQIVIGSHSNVQDGSVLHNDADLPLVIGDYVTIGHNATVHGCTIQNCVLIGMGAVILNGAVIEEGAIVAAGCVVKENMVVPAHSMAVGVPAKVVKQLDPADVVLRKAHAEDYEKLWRKVYRED